MPCLVQWPASMGLRCMSQPLVTNIGEAWRVASLSIDRLDARLLVQHVAGCTHVDLLARPNQALSTDQLARLGALVKRRSDGEPLAYLVNLAEFYSLEFHVTPAVLIPRPETELLVELAIERLQSLKAPRIVDLGTGCGILAVTLKYLHPAAIVSAVDLSPAALEVARINAARHAVEVSFLAGDWYVPLGGARFDLIVANPPYIEYADPHLQQNGLPFEPLMALSDGVDGGDGLACIRAIVIDAARHLLPDGWLLIEHGYNQAARVRDLLWSAGFSNVASWPDLSKVERVSGGCLD